MTLSALCSVLHVYVRRNQLDISDWLPLGALCDPDLSTRDEIGRVSAGQKFSIPAPPLLRSPPAHRQTQRVASRPEPQTNVFGQDIASYTLYVRLLGLVTQIQSNLPCSSLCDMRRFLQRKASVSCLIKKLSSFFCRHGLLIAPHLCGGDH